jgi:hypothetical protein
VDVQAEVMHDSVHRCLVSVIDDESAATHNTQIADRSAYADHPRSIPHFNILLSRRV